MKISNKLQDIAIGHTILVGFRYVKRISRYEWSFIGSQEIMRGDNKQVSDAVIEYFRIHTGCCGLDVRDVL